MKRENICMNRNQKLLDFPYENATSRCGITFKRMPLFQSVFYRDQRTFHTQGYQLNIYRKRLTGRALASQVYPNQTGGV